MRLPKIIMILLASAAVLVALAALADPTIRYPYIGVTLQRDLAALEGTGPVTVMLSAETGTEILTEEQLSEERRQINVLNVEIAHLEDPERLRALARRYLGFEPLDPSREVALSDLPLLADTRPEAEGVRRDQALVRQEEGALAMAEPTQVGGPD